MRSAFQLAIKRGARRCARPLRRRNSIAAYRLKLLDLATLVETARTPPVLLRRAHQQSKSIYGPPKPRVCDDVLVAVALIFSRSLDLVVDDLSRLARRLQKGLSTVWLRPASLIPSSSDIVTMKTAWRVRPRRCPKDLQIRIAAA
jgi:hypothetical protein